MEGGHQFLQETVRATSQQRMPAPRGQSVPNILYAEKWGQERHSDPVADRETSLPSEIMGGHRHKTGFTPRLVRRHPCEHSVGGKPQDNYNLPNDNQITDVRHTLLWRGTYRVLSQRSEHPITPIRFFRGSITSKSILVNNRYYWEMVQQYLPPVHMDSTQQP